MLSGLLPIERRNARLLILGTLPGSVSLQCGEYYAQSRNQFWAIMGELAGALPELPYARRIRALTDKGISVWDVCEGAERAGSLDAKIDLSTVVPNDFAGFLRSHRNLRLICFNGGKAADIWKRRVEPCLEPGARSIPCTTLSSTSHAHASKSLREKVVLWRHALAPFLGE